MKVSRRQYNNFNLSLLDGVQEQYVRTTESNVKEINKAILKDNNEFDIGPGCSSNLNEVVQENEALIKSSAEVNNSAPQLDLMDNNGSSTDVNLSKIVQENMALADVANRANSNGPAPESDDELQNAYYGYNEAELWNSDISEDEDSLEDIQETLASSDDDSSESNLHSETREVNDNDEESSDTDDETERYFENNKDMVSIF